MSAIEINDALRALSLKDLRVQCRARGITPAGNMEALKQRLGDDMRETQDLRMMAEPQCDQDSDANFSRNNYQRPGGNQNLGNRISDRNSSRVLAPPGGASQVMFGTHVPPTHPESIAQNAPSAQYHPPATPAQRAAESVLQNMGLGDTDSLVSGMTRDQGQAAGRPSHLGGGNGGTTSDRLFSNGAEGYPGSPVVARAHGAKGPPGLSQVAFGDHQLPSYTDQHGKYADEGKTPADIMHDATVANVDAAIRPLQLKELRTQLRARGLSPAGSQDALRTRLGEHMMATSDLRVVAEGAPFGMPSGAGPQPAPPSAAYQMQGGAPDHMANNYHRPGGQQNVGNFITDRSSSRVLAPPGGASQIMFGDHSLSSQGHSQQSTPMKGQPPARGGPPQAQGPPYPGYQAAPQQSPYGGGNPGYGASPDAKDGRLANNYSRPNGQQNVGNFITDRPSSRVIQPPGGKSQITFG